MSAPYILCWTRRRVWLVGPFSSEEALASWTAIGASSNAHDDPRWQRIEPNDGTFLMFLSRTYMPSDPTGFLHGAGWENE